ncbi:PREDICTED: tetraspanin-6-like [Amphimedon queenslandica]|uniref:Tetraspanin n=1 Tax=Amphimedon queenslandica TaxID=400682 RepID=A0A1X7V6Q6_AMPQE|nr:PREDICTED: tetraspanin-6-like [Amphimedon queenslandica]|eukprot:XP_011403062.1 PREDICTED: tetraspanin-6-like [Amphimedon queenslandica]
MGERTCSEYFWIILRIVLVIVNCFVVVSGIVLLGIGISSKIHKDEYIVVTDNEQVYAQVPWLMIFTGIFIIFHGMLGVVGAILAYTVCGRILLGLYGFVLALLVIIELSTGIAAAVEKGKLKKDIETSITNTFLKYNDTDTSYRDTWNTIQETLQCCGTYNYTAYENLLNMDPPTSCCIDQNNCDTFDSSGEDLFKEGCTEKIKENINSVILGAIAGVALTFAILQIIGVVVSCFVAACRPHTRTSYEAIKTV